MTDAIDRILDAVRGLSAAELDTLGRARVEAILERCRPGVAGIARRTGERAHAFEDEEDFREFISDAGNWRKAEWLEPVVWHPRRQAS